MHTHAREAWLATIALPALGDRRLLAHPHHRPAAGHGDIGNWSEPLGLAALFVEGAVIAVAGYALAALSPVGAVRPPRPRRFAGAR